MSRFHVERHYVIRKGGFGESVYLNGKGEWVAYSKAKQFKTQDAGIQFAKEKQIGDDFGLFPGRPLNPIRKK